MKIGIALSGGGARGVAHLGVLQALEEAGITPSIMTGVSAGAIVSVFYAAGFSPKQMLEILLEAGEKSFKKPTLKRGGIYSMDRAKRIYSKYLGEKTFEQLKFPVDIAAVDLKKGTLVHFSKGDVIPPIIASSSIPIVFHPLEYQDMLLIDGGALTNLTVPPLIGKCDFIIGSISIGFKQGFEKGSFLKVVSRISELSLKYTSFRNAELCDFIFNVKGLENIKIFDMNKGHEIFKIGYDFAKERIDLLKSRLEKKQKSLQKGLGDF